MAADQFPAATQNAFTLSQAADLADKLGAPVCSAAPAGQARPSMASRASQLMSANDKTDVRPSCQQSLNLTFYFDGTGNNRDADIGTGEHSNVARMFLAHKDNDKAIGLYAFYLPGIGTYFPEIGDPGGTTKGLAFGAEGSKRLDWAFKQFDEKLAYHVALAQNPTNKITMIRVAAFGFSRGATLARAFARMFHERCEHKAGGWQLKADGHPVRLTFLGLWDTVASVGLPMSANNTPLAQSLGLMSAETALKARNSTTNGVRALAFGQPGADPAPGSADGHMSWANPLDIGPMVEQCVHMVAAHEMRNSFPLDSCRRGMGYPGCVEEMVYPGVHSDVGGGYRPGEGARSDKPGQMLSLIPLRAMHRKAWEAGVPLFPLSGLPTTDLKEYFAADEASQPEFTKLVELWTHYMTQAGMGGRGIGQMFNAHMRLYYGWRFHKIRLNQAAQASGQDTMDAATLKQRERQWLRERRELEAEMKPAKAKMDAAQTALGQAKTRLRTAEQNQLNYGQAIDPRLTTSVAESETMAAQPTDDYLKLKARFDTLPGTEGQFAKNLAVYDAQLISDAQAIRATQRAEPNAPLRPHYRNLLDAYEAEFVEGAGLRDLKVIEFFDNYVHDSLAGFAQDATLPSDPRVIYLGADTKSQHAMNAPASASRAAVPA
jgi:Uncharacterized alpha/beta hydrolase domain (DUF2235)